MSLGVGRCILVTYYSYVILLLSAIQYYRQLMPVLLRDGKLIEKTSAVDNGDEIGPGDILDNVALEGNWVRVGYRDLV